MPLTTEEELELKALEQQPSEYRIRNIYGEDVSIPKMTEEQALQAVQVGAAGLPVGAPGALLKAAGGKGRQLIDFLSGKLAGIKPESVQAFKQAPSVVKSLVKAPELRRQEFASTAMKTASKSLGKRAGRLSKELTDVLSTQSIPESAVLPAGEFAPKGLADLITGKIPATEVYKAAQAAGREARFANNPLVVGAQKARAEDAGKAFGVLRGAVGEAVPAAEPVISALEKGVKASKTLSKAQARPLAFMTSGSPDIQASRQAAEELIGRSRLGRTAEQLKAAKDIASQPQGLAERVLKPVGLAGIEATAKIAPAASKLAEIKGALGQRALVQGTAPAVPTVGLTEEEELEYQRLLGDTQ